MKTGEDWEIRDGIATKKQSHVNDKFIVHKYIWKKNNIWIALKYKVKSDMTCTSEVW